MKFELKKVEYSKALSQETTAFDAEVWLNGKLAGNARNQGCGGQTDVCLNHLTPSERKDLQAWIEIQPAKVFPPAPDMPTGFTAAVTLDLIVDELMENWLEEKFGVAAQVRKWIKKNVVFRLKGDKPDEYRTLKLKDGKYTKRQRDDVIRTYGDKLETILNDAYGQVAV